MVRSQPGSSWWYLHLANGLFGVSLTLGAASKVQVDTVLCSPIHEFSYPRPLLWQRLTHKHLGDGNFHSKCVIERQLSQPFPLKLLSGEYHWTSVMISQHWFRLYCGMVPSGNNPLQWRHNEYDCVSNQRLLDCLLRRSKKTSKLRVTGICEGNSPTTGELLVQRASNAENVSIWWRNHDYLKQCISCVTR